MYASDFAVYFKADIIYQQNIYGSVFSFLHLFPFHFQNNNIHLVFVVRYINIYN